MSIFIMAVSHYGERLRDTFIGTSVWESREAALAALREDFAEDLAEDIDTELIEPDEIVTEDGLLDALRYYHNVIVTIDEHKV